MITILKTRSGNRNHDVEHTKNCEPQAMQVLNLNFVLDLKRAGKDGKFEGKKTHASQVEGCLPFNVLL